MVKIIPLPHHLSVSFPQSSYITTHHFQNQETDTDLNIIPQMYLNATTSHTHCLKIQKKKKTNNWKHFSQKGKKYYWCPNDLAQSKQLYLRRELARSYMKGSRVPTSAHSIKTKWHRQEYVDSAQDTLHPGSAAVFKCSYCKNKTLVGPIASLQCIHQSKVFCTP